MITESKSCLFCPCIVCIIPAERGGHGRARVVPDAPAHGHDAQQLAAAGRAGAVPPPGAHHQGLRGPQCPAQVKSIHLKKNFFNVCSSSSSCPVLHYIKSCLFRLTTVCLMHDMSSVFTKGAFDKVQCTSFKCSSHICTFAVIWKQPTRPAHSVLCFRPKQTYPVWVKH